jgi:hypothetical protein
MTLPSARFVVSTSVRALVVLALLAPVTLTAQSSGSVSTAQPAPGWTPPRTREGRPDLQGTWDFRTATPLERPREFAGREFFTAQEASEFERQAAERIAGTQAVHAPGWLDYGAHVLPSLRTSLIVDPADGRIPPLTSRAQARSAARARVRRGPAENPEDLNLGERCIMFSAGPPILPGPYNNNLQVVQTRDAVVFLTEMIHDARIVPLDGRPHVPPGVRFWLGDSRGRWDGDTLVVETTNFTDRTPFRGSDEALRVIERFTRVGPDTLLYEFTVDDPSAFTRPWTAAVPMVRSDERVYEYACHEGNYGMMNILRAARYDEQAASSRPR